MWIDGIIVPDNGQVQTEKSEISIRVGIDLWYNPLKKKIDGFIYLYLNTLKTFVRKVNTDGSVTRNLEHR